MKVLMLKDVSGIGNRGQIKEVKQGYALNYLLPNKLAILADDKTIKNFQTTEQAKKDKEALHDELAKKNLLEIDDKVVVIKSKASEKGKLFKSIHAEEIAKALELDHGIKINSLWLPKNFAIKEIGESKVVIEKLGLKISFTVRVETE